MIKILTNLLFGKHKKGVSSQPQGINHTIVPKIYLLEFPHNDLNFVKTEII